MREQHNQQIAKAWKWFDKCSALGCAMSKVPYEPERAEQAWADYELVYQDCGILPPQKPIGIFGV